MGTEKEISVTLDEKVLAKAITDAIGATSLKDKEQAEEVKKAITSAMLEQLNPVMERVQAIEKAQKELEEAKKDEFFEMGEEKIYKSKVGEAAFVSLKKAHEELVQKSKEIEKRDFEAKAESEYPHVSGSKEEKGAFLADIEKCLPEKSKAFAKSLLSALNTKTEGFTGSGGNSGKDGETGHAEVLKSKAAEYAKAHKISEAEAYVKMAQEMGDSFYGTGE